MRKKELEKLLEKAVADALGVELDHGELRSAQGSLRRREKADQISTPAAA